MRTPDPQTTRIANASGQADYSRVLVKDGGGTWRDVTTLFGIDFQMSVTLEESQDSNTMSLDVTLVRQSNRNSLSPQFTASRINQLGGAPLIAKGREIRLDAQTQPSGRPADASRWNTLCEGYIEQEDAGQDQMKVKARCKGGKLDRTYIQSELVYGEWRPGRRYLAGTVVLPAGQDPNNGDGNTVYMLAQNTGVNWGALWQPGHTYSAGAKVIPTTPNGFAYQTTGGGTSDPTDEPIWPTDIGGTVVDGSVTWTEVTDAAWTAVPSWPAVGSGGTVVDGGITWKEQAVQGHPIELQMQQILDDTMGAGVVTLNCPTSPSYDVRDYDQKKDTVMNALRALADIIGWDLRYLWDSGSSSFLLTLQAPGGNTIARTSPTVVETIDADHWRSLGQLEDDITRYRNIVSVSYSDRDVPDADGNPTLRRVVSRNVASIADLGPLWCELAFAATDGIDTQAEALALADNVVADLSNTLLSIQLKTLGVRWWLQLGDYITIGNNNYDFDTDLDGAVFVIRHTWDSSGDASTELTLRGKPSSGHQRWWQLAAVPGNAPQNTHVGPRNAISTSVTQVVGGVAASWKPPVDLPSSYDHSELHMVPYSTPSGWTPSSTTLKKIVRGHRVEHTDGLTPGDQYRVKVVHVDRKGNRSQPSAEQVQTAGQAQLIHLHPDVRRAIWGFVPTANEYNFVGSDGLIHYRTNVNNGYFLNGYDTTVGPDWDNGTYTWVPNTAAKYAVRAQVEMTGVIVGDSAQLYLYSLGAARYVGFSSVGFAGTDLWGGVRISCLLVLTVDVSATDVAGGASFVFGLKLGSTQNPVTIKAPSAALGLGSAVYSGTTLEITQLLVAPSP